jgi:putative inorganic carbon (HCO3(-)) transporter
VEPSPAIDLAAVLGGAGAALVALAWNRVALLAGLAVLAGATVVLGLLLLTDAERDTLMRSLERPELLVPAVLVAAGAAVAFVRRPGAVPVVLLAAAPFRVPIEVGNERVYLLLPLYGALAAALAALAYRAVRNDAIARPALLLAGPVALLVGLASLSMLWATDVRNAGIDLVFFYLPFAALFGAVARMRAAPWTRAALAVTLLALASFFALVGLVQVRTGNLPLAPDVEVANEYTSYTRVTSLFHDPSIYGRHLAIAIALVVALLWLNRIRIVVAVPLLGLLAAGLFVSYSQSSMVALFASVLVVSMLAAERRTGRMLLAIGAGATLVTVAVVLALAWNQSLRGATSGRSDLVANTAYTIAAHPIVGVGIGGEEKASREEGEKRGLLPKPSHTTPLTVAAELGLVGVAAYLLLLACLGRGLFLLRRLDRPLALTLTGTSVVLLVHSIFYSGFFEDPLTWGVLGLVASALAAGSAATAAIPQARQA